MATKTIYCIGNPALPIDSLALELADELEVDGYEFIKVYSPEELFSEDHTELIIMDVAEGIAEVKVLTDISKLKSGKMVSLHDFDLSYFLQLMEKLGTLPRVTIIALPMNGDKAKVANQLLEIFKTTLPRS